MCGATANGLIGTHFIPHSHDQHVPEMAAASAVALMGGMNFVGTMASGWLTDRYDPRRLLSIYFALRGVSLFILPLVTTFPGLVIFAVIYGLDWFATVPATVSNHRPAIRASVDGLNLRLAVFRAPGWGGLVGLRRRSNAVAARRLLARVRDGRGPLYGRCSRGNVPAPPTHLAARVRRGCPRRA